MDNNLVIVESPTKIKSIGKFLGRNYTIAASMGHVRDLPKKKMAIDVSNNFQPEYAINDDKKKIIQEIKNLAKNAKNIYLAPDPDREGEAIAWHIYEILKKYTSANFYRITFNEITKNAIQQSFKNLKSLDFNRVNAQQARRVLDRLVGYKVSPILWTRKATSAGRVQTVALRLIVEREKEIKAFIPKEYWTIKGDFKLKECKLEAELVKIDDKPLQTTSKQDNEKDKKSILISSKQDSEKHKKILEKQSFSIKDLAKKNSKKFPPPPFITSTLQQNASSKFGFSPLRTMRIAQQLYEGVEVEGQSTGLITYMRTDSILLSQEAKNMANQFIEKEFGKEFLGTSRKFKNQKNAQEAHEAIRPTQVNFPPLKIKHYLSDEQFKLYQLIWQRFIASQMKEALFEINTLEIANNSPSPHSYLFRANYTKPIFLGYLKALEENKTDKKQSIDFTKFQLSKGTEALLTKINPLQHFTEAPPRFNEASLIKLLEKNGIGRPSTYASTVEVIQKRGYVKKEKNKLYPTDIGSETSDFLTQSLPNLFNVKFTALMEEKLDKIEKGEYQWTEMLDNFYKNFQKWLLDIKINNSHSKEDFKTAIKFFKSVQIKWQEPQKIGNRKFDDKKFITDIEKSLEDKEKILSKKQWDMLVNLFIKYKSQFANYEEIKSTFKIKEKVNLTDSKDLKLIGILEKIEFEENTNNNFNEKEFVESLKNQAQNKELSLKQKAVLNRIAIKYKDKIENFDALKKEFKLEDTTTNPNPMNSKQAEEIKSLFLFAKNIKKWNSPNNQKNFDDKSFISSLNQQFQQKKSLSPKQIYALKKTLKKYQEQVPKLKSFFNE